MSNAIERIEPQEHAITPASGAPLTPMDMLNRAVEQGANIDVMSKLMDLQERWEANQARRAFGEAIASAKAEIEPIVKNKRGHNSSYANFAAYARAIDPIITKYGLFYRFRTTQDDRIHVTCVLSHRDGYSEENTLAGPADNSGAKNAIQAIGSTLSYLQRYTLIQALGLAASEDDDGKAAGIGKTISDDQKSQIVDLMKEVNANTKLFLQHFRIGTLDDLPATDFDRAVALLKQKKEKANANG